jgi:hypothetical protein
MDSIILTLDGQPVQMSEGRMPGGGDDLDALF